MRSICPTVIRMFPEVFRCTGGFVKYRLNPCCRKVPKQEPEPEIGWCDWSDGFEACSGGMRAMPVPALRRLFVFRSVYPRCPGRDR